MQVAQGFLSALVGVRELGGFVSRILLAGSTQVLVLGHYAVLYRHHSS